MILPQLRRVRWAVRATLVLGVAASVVANVLHALDNPISQAIAAWPPLALLLTVELISRVPVHRRSLAFARLVATATIAGIAAWVSYWHMAGVAARYGETGASPYLLPLSVDGLIVVASICLVELGGRISALERERREPEHIAAVAVSLAPAPGAADDSVPGLIPVPTAVRSPATAPATAAASRRSTAEALAEVAAALPKNSLPKTRGAEVSSFTPSITRGARPVAAAKSGPARPTATASVRPASSASVRPAGSGPAKSSTKPSAKPSAKSAPRVRRTPADTIAAAEKIKAGRPDVTDTELAAELGISASRWRTIRREAEASAELRLAA